MKIQFVSISMFVAVFAFWGLAAEAQEDGAAYEPLALYLTWVEDPATSMVIHWHSTEPATRRDVQFRPEGTEADWRTIGSWTRPMPLSDRTIHMAQISGLEPDTGYDFRFGEDSTEYAFRTMPATADEPIVFVAGGDTAPLPNFTPLCEQAAARSPRFAVVGGDIAYGNGELVDRWYAWFDVWTESMVTPEGYRIPVVVGIGNHEVKERYYHDGGRFESAPFFGSLFAFPGYPGYKALDFRGYLSLILLDSGHINPIDGRQTAWLEGALEARRDVTFTLPVYHVPAYPSNRDFNGSLQTQIREEWVPLFDRYNVRAAFENHDHTYKRTPAIRGNEANPAGVTYIGDGSWGVPVREVHSPEETWYLERAESVQHVIVVTLHNESLAFDIIDIEGESIDTFEITASAEAE